MTSLASVAICIPEHMQNIFMRMLFDMQKIVIRSAFKFFHHERHFLDIFSTILHHLYVMCHSTSSFNPLVQKSMAALV